MNFLSVEKLPQIVSQEKKSPISTIFSPSMAGMTLILTLAYFLHIMTFYFILKWSPKVVADMGFHPSLAGQALVAISIGGAIGAAVFGGLTHWFELKKLTITILLLTAIFVAVFGRTAADLLQIKLLAGLAGFFGNAGISGLYSILAISFPTEVRATGTGFVIGTGRAGAVLSPILAGILLQTGAALPVVAMTMGTGAMLAAGTLFLLKLEPQ